MATIQIGNTQFRMSNKVPREFKLIIFHKEIFLDINQPTKSINSRHMLKLHRKPFGVAIISWCKTSNSIENSTSNNQLTTFNKKTQRANNMNAEEVLCLLLLFLFEVVTIQNLVIFWQFFWTNSPKLT